MITTIRNIAFVCALVCLTAALSFAQPAGGCTNAPVGPPVLSLWTATNTYYACVNGVWTQFWPVSGANGGLATDNGITFNMLDPAVVQKATVNITSANILAMNGTPVSVLAAPGAGKAILVHRILFEMTTTSTAYASGGTVQFQYHGAAVVHAGTIPASVVTAGAGTSYTMLGGAVGANGTTVTANVGVDITNNTGAFTTGTGTAVVQIWYSIVTL